MRTRNYLCATLCTSALLGLIDLIWLSRSQVRFSPTNWRDIVGVGLCICIAGLISWLVSWRVRGDQSQMGLVVRKASDSLGSLALAGAAFVPLLIGSTILMHVASATARPLEDAELAYIDSRLGFDWLWFLAVTNHKLIAPALSIAYHFLGPQVPFVFLLNIVKSRNDRLLEFITLLAMSSILAGGIMAFVPAEGAYAYFKPSADQFSHFTGHAGMWHYKTLMALRSGEPFDLIMTNSSGLVTFPSYHTALGIIIVYALRDYRRLFWSLACLNGVMIIATLPEGGHHLIDVLAGSMVGLVSIVATRIIGAYEGRQAGNPDNIGNRPITLHCGASPIKGQ
ncbi:MAG: phosphatase PAP2 family protein [Mesorhizobium sp.]|uniref:phosphatase PAP2 family protein n=1 Tax=Mesorhizobium sp. TaxID=1871066 RepID=UPI000FEA6A37|nr:phosphatase PAP2 family protein [Mesorhizobium sp.]RWB79171.1 MAG: phosphatase PAP2 family protein [Mesorhizobium sp.]